MKTRILALTTSVILISLIMYSCGTANGPLSTLNNILCLKYDQNTMNTLEVQLIRNMTDKYKDKQLDAINRSTTTKFTLNDSDSRVIWFDLETLKEFIYHIEMEAKKNSKSVTSEDLGIHIYYASYPEFQDWEMYKDLPGTGQNVLTSNYEERHTLVMVPTMRRDNVNIDFNPLDPDTYTTSLTSLEKYVTGTVFPSGVATQILALNGTPSSGSTGSQNHGGLYPPLGDSGLGF